MQAMMATREGRGREKGRTKMEGAGRTRAKEMRAKGKEVKMDVKHCCLDYRKIYLDISSVELSKSGNLVSWHVIILKYVLLDWSSDINQTVLIRSGWFNCRYCQFLSE